MFRILDRYLVREIVTPFFLGLAVLTFILEIPPILTLAEQFISNEYCDVQNPQRHF